MIDETTGGCMLYIHIGFHKTGSSTIQHFADVNSGRLANMGIIYPKIGRNLSAHFSLVTELKSNNSKGNTSCWAELLKQVDADPSLDFCVSSEGFQTINAATVRRVAQLIGRRNVTIVAYIRHWAEFIPSRYSQQAKSGSFINDFDAFYSKFMEGAEDGFRFFPQLNRWAKVFGWEKIRVRSLDPQSLEGGNLLHDFIAALGRQWPQIEPIAENSLTSRNVSPGWKCVELTRAAHIQMQTQRANRDLKKSKDFKSIKRQANYVRREAERIWAELGIEDEKIDYLTPVQREMCNHRYEREVVLINRHITGPDLPVPMLRPVSGRPFLPEADRVPVAERTAFFAQLTKALQNSPE